VIAETAALLVGAAVFLREEAARMGGRSAAPFHSQDRSFDMLDEQRFLRLQ
jgi:hypothetical protein